MSHIVSMKTEIRNPECVRAACRRLGIAEPVAGTHRLYDGNYSGLGVQLDGWHYPIVLDVESGSIKYDNYGGAWGDAQRLRDFTNACGVEAVRMEASAHGHAFEEEVLPDGTIAVTLTAGW